MDPFLAGFVDELEKISFSLDDAINVLRIAKKKTVRRTHRVPRRFKRAAGKRTGGEGLGAYTMDKPIDVRGEKTTGFIAGRQRTRTPEHIVSHRLSPKEKHWREGAAKGHELDELHYDKPGRGRQGRRQSSVGRFGHANWDVLLREHNRAATLPKGMAPARRAERSLREKVHQQTGGSGWGKRLPFEVSEAAILRAAGVPYGRAGSRLSRHKRKDVSKYIDRQISEIENLEDLRGGQAARNHPFAQKIQREMGRIKGEQERRVARAKRQGEWDETSSRVRRQVKRRDKPQRSRGSLGRRPPKNLREEEMPLFYKHFDDFKNRIISRRGRMGDWKRRYGEEEGLRRYKQMIREAQKNAVRQVLEARAKGPVAT